GGHVRGGVDPQGAVVGGGPDDLFAPVAQDVARQGRGGLGAVVAVHPGGGEQAGLAAGPVLVDPGLVQQFAHRVAVPPGQEVGRGRLAADHGAGGVPQPVLSRAGGPGLGAGAPRVDVAGHAASRSLAVGARAGAGLPEHPAGAGLDHVEAGAVRRLGDLHVLLPGAARVEVAQVGGVAVAPADVPQAAAVVVDGRRAVHDLVAAVAVDVADGEGVVALARVRAVAGGVGVERPALDQPAVAEVPGGDDAAGVVAAGHDEAGPPPVEVGGPGQEAVHPVAVVVAPGGDVAAGRVVVHGGQGGAGPAVEHGQVLGAGQDVAAGVAVVRAGVADDGAAAVHGAVGGLHRDLGPAVAVVVVDLE